MFFCNEAEGLSPLGLHINILDGAHNFKEVLTTSYCKKRRIMLFIFNLNAIYIFCMGYDAFTIFQV
jgi:hypothetical protein